MTAISVIITVAFIDDVDYDDDDDDDDEWFCRFCSISVPMWTVFGEGLTRAETSKDNRFTQSLPKVVIYNIDCLINVLYH